MIPKEQLVYIVRCTLSRKRFGRHYCIYDFHGRVIFAVEVALAQLKRAEKRGLDIRAALIQTPRDKSCLRASFRR
jgi:hypothetical protein